MIITRANDIGIKLAAETDTQRIQAIVVYPEYGSVHFWVHLSADYKDKVDQLLQYLTPQEAMALANGLERCAVAALKEGA